MRSYSHAQSRTQGSRRDQKIKGSRGGRWSWTLKLAQKRSWVGRCCWAAKVGLLWLWVVPQQQCNGHCLCDSAQTRQLKQQLHSAEVAGQRRGDTALTLPLFWRRSTVSSVFFGRYPRSSLHSFVPPLPTPPVPVPNKQPRFCGHKTAWSRSHVRQERSESAEERRRALCGYMKAINSNNFSVSQSGLAVRR